MGNSEINSHRARRLRTAVPTSRFVT